MQCPVNPNILRDSINYSITNVRFNECWSVDKSISKDYRFFIFNDLKPYFNSHSIALVELLSIDWEFAQKAFPSVLKQTAFIIFEQPSIGDKKFSALLPKNNHLIDLDINDLSQIDQSLINSLIMKDALYASY